MMIKDYNLTKLQKLLRTRKVICFGYGKAFSDLCKDINLEKYIDYIVDNDEEKWNKEVAVKQTKLFIYSPEYMMSNISEQDIILITNKKYNDDIILQLKSDKRLEKVICIPYPKINNAMTEILRKIFTYLPLRNILLFQGPGDFYENAYAIRDYLYQCGLIKKYKLVWIINEDFELKDTRREKYILRNCLRYQRSWGDIIKYLYYFSASKYLFYESHPIGKYRDNQILTFLGHGAFSLKKSKGIIVTSESVDHVLCTSENCIEGYCEQTRSFRKQIFICGCPRNDVLFSKKQVIGNLTDKKYKKIIIWMPTMRKSKSSDRKDSNKVYLKGLPIIESDTDMDIINDTLHINDVLLLIKTHPMQDLSVYDFDQYSNIMYVTQKDLEDRNVSTYELMKDTDALITDYSSVSFDYLLLDRPIAYTLDDMDNYTLGFAMDNPQEFMPGDKILSMKDMLYFIECVAENKDSYAGERSEIRNFVHAYQDGDNSKRVIDFLGL